jgi:predicted nuclease with TOPRIM domain
MGKSIKENLEDLRADSAQLQEENEHLKEKVQMFNKRMEEMEKHLDTFSKLFSFLNNKFEESQDSLTTVIKDWEKHRV